MDDTTTFRAIRNKLFQPRPKITVSEWADNYRKLSPESSAEPGQWRASRTEYIRGILDGVTDPDVDVIVVMSSAQVGKTEIILNTSRNHIDWDPCPKEASAQKIKIELGLRPISDVIRESGRDPQEVFKEIANDQSIAAELGIDYRPTRYLLQRYGMTNYCQH